MGLTYQRGRWTVDVWRQTTYEIVMGRGVFARSAELLDRQGAKRRLAVVDARVDENHHERLRDVLSELEGETSLLIIETSEATKERPAVDQIHGAALDFGLSRRDELIAIGGGVLLDLVGVAAAELRKETAYVIVPTTVVGLVDAGVGAKRAINFRWRGRLKKSFVGDYHPARLAILDPDFLVSLDARELRGGLAEIKKVAEMVDGHLFAMLEESGESVIAANFRGEVGDEILRRSIDGILSQLPNDLWEESLERWPDHGHSVSPKLEEEAGMVHGLAVSVCCSLGAAVALGRKYIDERQFDRMVALALRLGLPVWHPRLADRAFLEAARASTALVRNGHHWPIPAGIGRYAFVEPGIDELLRASQFLHERAKNMEP